MDVADRRVVVVAVVQESVRLSQGRSPDLSMPFWRARLNKDFR